MTERHGSHSDHIRKVRQAKTNAEEWAREQEANETEKPSWEIFHDDDGQSWNVFLGRMPLVRDPQVIYRHAINPMTHAQKFFLQEYIDVVNRRREHGRESPADH